MRTASAPLSALILCLVLAVVSPVSAQEQPAGSAQYPGEGEPIPAQYGETPVPVDEPPGAQPSQYPPDDAEAPPEDECDPAQEECSADETGDFVDEAAGDAQQTSDTLNGTAGAPSAPAPVEESAPPPAEEPAPETPTATDPDPEQYTPVTAPSSKIGAASAPQPAPAPVGYPNGGFEPAASPAEPRAGTVPVQETQPTPQPPPEARASTEEPSGAGPVPERAVEPAAPVRDAPGGEARGEVERTEPESESASEVAPRRGETDGGPRPATTFEEPGGAEQRELAAEGGKSTIYTLGASALLIAGVALVGRFLKR